MSEPFSHAPPVALAIALVCCVVTIAQDQTPPRFGSRVVLVPVDVRVVDGEGNPITDLTAADFRIFENDVEQKIAQFLPVSFAGADSSSRAVQAPSNDLFGKAATPQRSFVVVLGRGRLNRPTKALEALIDFVRRGLLRDDQVGVIAFLRASELTTDHEAVARFLERYRDQHEAIEGKIDRDFEMGVMGRPVTLAADTRSAIDALFRAPNLPVFRDLPGSAGTSASRYLDLAYFLRAIEHLRRVDGEKHLLFVAEQPLSLGRIAENPNENYFVRLATGARVAFSFLHAGGVATQPMVRGRLSTRAGGISDRELFAPTDHRLLAEQTGGISAFYQYTARPLAYLDHATRFQYLVGYYPTAEVRDDEHRLIRIVVNRPGVTVLYRHGYQVRPREGEPDDFRRAIAGARIAASMSRLTSTYNPRPEFTRSRTPLKLSTTAVSGEGDEIKLDVRLSFDPTRVTFAKVGDDYQASLDVAVAVDGANGTLLAEQLQRIELKLSSRDFERTKREWLACNLKLAMNGRPKRVRAVVYDYDSDRVAAASFRIEHR